MLEVVGVFELIIQLDMNKQLGEFGAYHIGIELLQLRIFLICASETVIRHLVGFRRILDVKAYVAVAAAADFDVWEVKPCDGFEAVRGARGKS